MLKYYYTKYNLNYKGIYQVQKYKLDEKTKNMKKQIIESAKASEPRSKCC